MNKRKVDSAAYTGAGALGDNFEAEVANWEAHLNADVARGPQPGVAASPFAQLDADVARGTSLEVAPNPFIQLNVDVAQEPQRRVVTNSETWGLADVADRPQPTATSIWADTVSTEVKDLSNQAPAEGTTDSGPLYTDFWALLADAGYEAW